ncbi:hypothetical protein TrVE_jg10723 [Triparma verrucosa]|uniref:START domain-containing protein n=1 Tax=Triparma verrucosa TaxID=1606542 RepID=A0A9W7C7H1_9STRA|nr:hypothetical protein TrVE_jg10723 [Triparma verrucosa]
MSANIDPLHPLDLNPPTRPTSSTNSDSNTSNNSSTAGAADNSNSNSNSDRNDFSSSQPLAQRFIMKALFTGLNLSKAFGEKDRVISSDSNRRRNKKSNKKLPLLQVTPKFLWGAITLDLKICAVAVLIGGVCVPIMMLMISVIHRPQFNAHFDLPYSASTAEENPPDPTFTQSETLFGLIGMNRLLWALWIINMRHLYSPLALKRRRRTFLRLTPFLVETLTILISFISSSKIRSSRALTTATYIVAMYISTTTEIIVNHGLKSFWESKILNAIVVPIFVGVLFYLMPCLMVLYAYSLEIFKNNPVVEFAVISLVYPGLMMITKNFMLGKQGSSILLNSKGSHMNEDFDRSDAILFSYTGTVRAIHGLWLPQVVGIFLMLDDSIVLFALTLIFRIGMQSVGKYVIWSMESDLIKVLAKKDGVYDGEEKIFKKISRLASGSKNRKEAGDRQGHHNHGRKAMGFFAPKAINTHAHDFDSHIQHPHHKLDFKHWDMKTANFTNTNEPPSPSEQRTAASQPPPQTQASFEEHPPRPNDDDKGMKLFYPESPHNAGGSNHSTHHSVQHSATHHHVDVGELLDQTNNLRYEKAKDKGLEFDIKLLKKDYDDLRECKYLMVKCKETASAGWTAVGRQELGCQIWIKENHYFWNNLHLQKSRREPQEKPKDLVPQGSIECKCMGFIEGADTYEVFEYLRKHSEREGQSISRKSKTKLVTRLSFNRDVYYMRYKLHSPINDRELVFEQYCCRLPTGSFVIKQKSWEGDVEAEAGIVPGTDGAIRINLLLGGYLVENYHTHGVTVTQYNNTNPGGNLPKALTRLYAPLSLRGVINLKSYFVELRLWPAITEPYEEDEEKAIEAVLQTIETFLSSKEAKLLKDLSWEVAKKTPHGVEMYQRNNEGNEIIVSTTVSASAVEVASHLYYKVVDKDDELISKRNDHCFNWYRFYDMPTPFSARDAVYFSCRKKLPIDRHDGAYVIVFKSYDDPNVPRTSDIIRSYGIGGYVIKPKGKHKCVVTRSQFIDFSSGTIKLPAAMSRSIFQSAGMKTLNEVKDHFRGLAEGKRVESIRKARQLGSVVAWRDGTDPYTPAELKEVEEVKAALQSVQRSVAAKEGWVNIGTDKGVDMFRKSITTTKSSSELSFHSDPTKRRGSQKKGRLSGARFFPRLSHNKNKVESTAGGSDSFDQSASDSFDKMEEGRRSSATASPTTKITSSTSEIPRKWSNMTSEDKSSRSGGTGGSKKVRYIYHGYAVTDIDASASLVMAWLCDDKFQKGVREVYDRDLISTEIDRTNDHHFIDYRQIQFGWPLQPRFVALDQLQIEDEDRSYWCISKSLAVPKEKLAGLDEDAIEARYFSIFHVMPIDDKRSHVVTWVCADPRGSLPSWALKIKVPEVIAVIVHCKSQLDDTSLIAKRSTYSERMNIMRKRVAIKWNNEALVEKICNFLGGVLAKFVIGFSYQTLVYGLLAFVVEESLSDILTMIMCKSKLNVDMVKADLKVGNSNAVFSQIMSTLSVSVSCVAAFIFVQQFVPSDPLPEGWLWIQLGLKSDP